MTIGERTTISALVYAMKSNGWRVSGLRVDDEWIPVTSGLELRDTLAHLEAFDRGTVVFVNADGESAEVTIALGQPSCGTLFSDYRNDDPVGRALEKARLN